MNYQFDSFVNRQEAAALKEMIFRRAKERSESMNEQTQSDVMDLARESFVSKNNPFSQIAGGVSIEEAKSSVPSDDEAVPVTSGSDEIGFPQKELKLRQNTVINEQITTSEINSNMREAREALSSRRGFMGALNFLNSQAAVSLIRTRADKFEALV